MSVSSPHLFLLLFLLYQLLYDHTDPIPGDEKWPVIGQFSSIGSMGWQGNFSAPWPHWGNLPIARTPPCTWYVPPTHTYYGLLLVCCGIQMLWGRSYTIIQYKWDFLWLLLLLFSLCSLIENSICISFQVVNNRAVILRFHFHTSPESLQDIRFPESNL